MLDKDTLLLEKPASGLCYQPHCKTVSLSWCGVGLALEWLRGADWPLLKQTSALPAHGALHFVTMSSSCSISWLLTWGWSVAFACAFAKFQRMSCWRFYICFSKRRRGRCVIIEEGTWGMKELLKSCKRSSSCDMLHSHCISRVLFCFVWF